MTKDERGELESTLGQINKYGGAEETESAGDITGNFSEEEVHIFILVVVAVVAVRTRGTLPANAQIECRVDDGFAWVNRERGCGCGHGALKALTPPVGWTREAVSA